MEKRYNVISSETKAELTARRQFMEIFTNGGGIPPNELLNNLGLFINRQNLSRILFMHELYQKIINVHGIVAEFGVRFGQNRALFSNLTKKYPH